MFGRKNVKYLTFHECRDESLLQIVYCKDRLLNTFQYLDMPNKTRAAVAPLSVLIYWIKSHHEILQMLL